MIYPSADKLETWGNKYALVSLAAKRAKQLKNGAPPLIDTESTNPLTIALEEIAAGKIGCAVPDVDVVASPAMDLDVAQLLPISGEEEEEEAEAAAPAEEEQVEAAAYVEDEEEPEEAEEEDEDREHLPVGLEEDAEELVAVGIADDAEEVAEPDVGLEASVEPSEDEIVPKPKRRRRAKAVDVDAPVFSPAEDDAAGGVDDEGSQNE